MPTTKMKADLQSENGLEAKATGEVLTLAEAAAYLRVTEPDVIRMVEQQNLPGRCIGQEWRFLKSALQDWLRTPLPRPTKEAVLSRIGSWQDDPYFEQELEEIHQRRGRPKTTGGK
jgi:excisionase family DNA binding protein